MEGLTPDIQQSVDQQALIFAKYLEKKLLESIGKTRAALTGELRDSIRVTVRKSTAQDLSSIILEFNDYGRFVDMAKLFWSKQPPVDDIREFVEKIGLSKFKFIPGYKNSAPISQFKAAERIAWAIAKKKRVDWKHKRKKWKQDTLGIALSYLTHLVADKFAEFAVNAMALPLEKK